MSAKRTPSRRRDGILSAISAGAFFVIVGSIFIIHPNLFNRIIDFFNDFNLVSVIDQSNIVLPAPTHVARFVDVYRPAQQFSIVWAIFLVAMLVVRFALNSSTYRKAENISDIIFWFGAAYLIQTWLINSAHWFEFWAMIVIVAGISLIARAAYLAAAAATHR